MQLSEGQTFAGYTIVRGLGAGGMGEVYLAQHPRLPRRDALKLLRADVSAAPDYRARFEREADLASTLWHPNIVGVHDRGETDRRLWIAMDYVDGPDVGQLVAQRYPAGMPVNEVVTIVSAIANALDYAHSKGLLHRDIKPANIIVTHPGGHGEQRILLSDFGIARTLGEISGLTETNATIGTVAYAAPEQLMGEDVDGRADQYALTATAYHLLTGTPLFAHTNPAVVISRHLNAPLPKLADTRPELVALDPVLAVGLAKERDQRFTSCTDFARALADHASSPAGASAMDRTRPAPTQVRQPAPGDVQAAPATSKTRPHSAPATRLITGVAAIAGIAAVVLAVTHLGPERGATVPPTAAPTPQSPSVTTTPRTASTPPTTPEPTVAETTITAPPPITTLTTNSPTADPGTGYAGTPTMDAPCNDRFRIVGDVVCQRVGTAPGVEYFRWRPLNGAGWETVVAGTPCGYGGERDARSTDGYRVRCNGGDGDGIGDVGGGKTAFVGQIPSWVIPSA